MVGWFSGEVGRQRRGEEWDRDRWDGSREEGGEEGEEKGKAREDPEDESSE